MKNAIAIRQNKERLNPDYVPEKKTYNLHGCPFAVQVEEKLDATNEKEALQPYLQWFWKKNWENQLENDFRIDSKNTKSVTPLSKQKSCGIVQQESMVIEVKETNKHVDGGAMSMKCKKDDEHANYVEEKTTSHFYLLITIAFFFKGKSPGYIDNLISFIDDKFNCLDKCLKNIEAKVQKIDSLEDNTTDVREMSGQINKIVNLGEFLNSADYNLKVH
ncbi:hypothetical protein WN944_024312 [Citrus x changshan-huyou]|uniref:Uncharacterized protein n=1 Tax=Citrus x changshan-huyou TaxID=2935761 RepID=A0AAP0QCH4_9ROSI